MMKTVKEVSRISGVSVRTLHYYDEIGLLAPSGITDAGYRLYDDTALERLSQILFFGSSIFRSRKSRRFSTARPLTAARRFQGRSSCFA